MNTTIKVKCVDQTLTIVNSPTIASGDVLTDSVEFEFCPKWDGLAKTAVFWRSPETPYKQILDVDNTCIIPAEVLTEDGILYFGVFGVDGNGKIKTSETVRYKIKQGAFTTASTPSTPTAEVWEQVLAACNTATQTAQNALNKATQAETIAKGRATGYVFDTVSDMNTWLANADNVANLVLGDNFYIRATDAPDYWWDGSQAQELETEKVDLSGYATDTELNAHTGNINNPHNVTAAQVGAAAAEHTHTEYAPVNHTHEGYAPTSHNHDAAYAPISHTHTLSSLGAAAAPQTKELFLDTSGWDSSGIRWETVAGVTSDSIIIVTPDSSSMKIWAEAGVRCVTSRSGELKFACDTVPSDYVTAQILIVG